MIASVGKEDLAVATGSESRFADLRIPGLELILPISYLSIQDYGSSTRRQPQWRVAAVYPHF